MKKPVIFGIVIEATISVATVSAVVYSKIRNKRRGHYIPVITGWGGL